jgi:Fe2+ or Zn2+ uptake regulation protein
LVDEPAIEAWTDSTAKQNGFVEACHHLETVGLCAGCAAEAAD